MHPRAVLGRQEEKAQKVVRVVEELAQAARGDERRGVDVDADEAEQLMVVEGGGSRALDARSMLAGPALGCCRSWIPNTRMSVHSAWLIWASAHPNQGQSVCSN